MDATTDIADQLTVVDNQGKHHYEALLDGRVVGFSAYKLIGDRIVFLHTEVADEVEGLGVGSRLARGALDDVRRRGLRVTAKCPFIAAWLRRHDDYSDLIGD